MAITGKVGADAIAAALRRICIILNKYQSKLLAANDAALAAGAITDTQHDNIVTFVAVANVSCVAFLALANYCGF